MKPIKISAPPRYVFGPRAIEVGHFILERRRAGDHIVEAFEYVHEAFPGLTFFDFMGGFIYADCFEGDTLSIMHALGGVQ